MRRLILASTSPFRRRILADAGITALGVAPEVSEEVPASLTDVAQVVEHLAVKKARAVAARYPEALVIGGDQLAYLPEDRGAWFGKPESEEAHLSRLTSLVGRSHVLVTGLAVLEPGFEHVSHHETVMHVRADITSEELATYVATGEGAGCAAGYAAEGRGAFLFSRVEGDFFNVLGLPLYALISVLRARGWTFGPGEGAAEEG